MELTVTHVIRLSPEVEALLRDVLGRLAPKPPFAIGAKEPAVPSWLTSERLPVLRATYPNEASMADVLARLNALPGPRVTSGSVFVEAAKLGLRRPPPPKRAPVVPVPRMLPDRTPSPWTDERLLALQVGWERGDADEDILAIVNGLPGEKIASAQVLRAKALDEAFVRPRTAPAPIVDGKVLASWAQIDAWAAPRGLRMQAAADLVPINIKRGQLGLPLFAVPEVRAL